MEREHWITERQFADAVAIGKLTPGPVLLLATFIGYLRHGWLGAVVATIVIFAAPFALVATAGTWLDRIRSRRPVRAALRGLTPAGRRPRPSRPSRAARFASAGCPRRRRRCRRASAWAFPWSPWRTIRGWTW